MARFGIMINGREVFAETLDDLEALLERFPGSATGGTSSHHADVGRGVKGDAGRWSPSRFKDFTGRLTQPQLRLLQELVKSPHGRTSRDLAQVLGFRDAKVFGPLLAAISKHAKKTGVGIQEVLATERIDVGDNEKTTQLKATDAFARAAVDAGWVRG
jgi:hypothetical protein